MKLLDQLNPRERVIVLGGGAVLALLAGWLYVWQPLMRARADQTDRIARYLSVIDLTRAARLPMQSGTAAPRDTRPLAARITQSADAAAIPLARLDPDGGRLRVTVAAADFVQLMGWIASLETTENLRVVSLDMARLTPPGQVSLRLTLARADAEEAE